MKATFNLNSERLGEERFLIREDVRVNHTKNKPEDVKHIYAGHKCLWRLEAGKQWLRKI